MNPQYLLEVEMQPFDVEIVSVVNIGASQAEQRGDEIIQDEDETNENTIEQV